jgi:hypothetical protein
MYLENTDIIAIIIALVGCCVVMVYSIMENRRLLMQIKNLKKVIKILQAEKKKV